MWASAASGRGARAGGRCRRRSATSSAGSSARRPARSSCTRTSRSPRRSSSPASPGRSRRGTGSSTSEANFPSVRYLYQAQPDLEVVVVRGRRGDRRARSTSARCSSRSATSSSRTAEIQDVEPIVRRAHEVGAHVDPRLLPVGRDRPVRPHRARRRLRRRRLRQVALRRPGDGWLYVRPDLAERLEPTFTGWQAHARPFAFEEEMEYAARRAPVPHRHAERAGATSRRRPATTSSRRSACPRSARTRSRQTQLLIDLADDARASRSQPARAERRGGTVTLARAGPRAVHAELDERARSSATSGPDAGIRLGPHFFTTDDEIRFAVSQIAEILESGAYRRHEGAIAVH